MVDNIWHFTGLPVTWPLTGLAVYKHHILMARVQRQTRAFRRFGKPINELQHRENPSPVSTYSQQTSFGNNVSPIWKFSGPIWPWSLIFSPKRRVTFMRCNSYEHPSFTDYNCYRLVISSCRSKAVQQNPRALHPCQLYQRFDKKKTENTLNWALFYSWSTLMVMIVLEVWYLRHLKNCNTSNF